MEMAFADQCYAVYVANASSIPAHIVVELGMSVPPPPSDYIFIPSGSGASITYTPYDPVAGLPPGQAAILFLAGSPTSSVPCPSVVTMTAIPNGSMVHGTGLGQAFHIATDVPVAAYQMNPYGGGIAALPGASLLFPTSAWGTNYVAATAAPYASAAMGSPSLDIVAMTDATQVTILPGVAVQGGAALPAGPANAPYTFTLNQGQVAQLSQQADLSGSVIQSTSPVGVMAGNACMQEPIGTDYCDHGEQMLAPVQALGSEYVGVMFRPRVPGDAAFWRIVGAVNGTTLSYVPAAPAGAPTSISQGQIVEFDTDQPFVVRSQDAQHPFMLFTLMSGSQWSGLSTPGYGDPDFVVAVPPSQYRGGYTFFADPTFPENDLVFVRTPDASGVFHDVTLDCAGTLTGWAPIGNYQWARVDLTRHAFQAQGSCSAGLHTATSEGSFGLTVWGWGSPETQNGTCDPQGPDFTCYVSYGYPAGMSVGQVNLVVIPPTAM